jgi:hypothetical protein
MTDALLCRSSLAIRYFYRLLRAFEIEIATGKNEKRSSSVVLLQTPMLANEVWLITGQFRKCTMGVVYEFENCSSEIAGRGVPMVSQPN